MRTKKAKHAGEQWKREIKKEIAKFSQHFMSNSKWVKLIEVIVANAHEIKKIQFKKIQNEKIGELYLDENSIFEFDYWDSAFEGNNSFGDWLQYKEIEYLSFPKILDSNTTQDLEKISTIIQSIGEFCLESDENELRLICYRK